MIVAGLNTTVFPATSAGAIFHTGIAIGKFHGVMQATTPCGATHSSVTETAALGLDQVSPARRARRLACCEQAAKLVRVGGIDVLDPGYATAQ